MRCAKRLLQDRSGQGLDTLLVGMFFILFLTMIGTGLSAVAWLYAAKQHAIQTMVVAVRQAESAASATPNLATGQGNFNPQIAANTFNQVFSKQIEWPASVYQIQTFTVYTQSQAGQPLPVGFSGNIPGPSIYVQAQFTFSLLPFWNPTSAPMTVRIPVKVVVSPNRFNHPGQTWIGG